ncbi:MAG: PQQ-binding-like beta-propeller repeat protein [Acidobacteria bacterium]|nr:PQQ-binding-like beta-propeller repeat protein [Acidobacteriota bacterium]
MRTVVRCLLLATFVTAASSAEDWPDFRGPHRDGRSAEAVAPSWGEGGPTVIWDKPVGAGFSNPVVAHGRVIVFHRLGGEEVIEALEAATGKTVWKFSYPTTYRDGFGFDPGPRASPVVAGGQVYTFGAEGVMTCVSFATGKKIWQRTLNQEYGVQKGYFGAGATPLADGSRLFLNLGGADGAGIVALDKDTGRELWKALDHDASYASPVLAKLHGEPRVIFFTREGIVLTTPEGKVVFEKRWRARMDASVNAAAPLVDGDIVFFSASYGTGAIALDFSQGDEPVELWSGEDGLTNHYAAAVLSDGVLYGYHGRQEYGPSLRAVELRTGKVLWNEDGFGAGTVTLAGDTLILMREKGELVTAKADPKAFRPLARAQVLPTVVRAYPALADGTLYVRDEKTLVALRLR